MKKLSVVLVCCALPLLGCPEAKQDSPATTEDGVAEDSSTEDLETVALADSSVGVDTVDVSIELTANEDAGPVPIDAAPETVDAGPDIPVEPIQCLGTVYPDSGPIDPDNPVYENEYYTQEQVTKMFAQAKADNTKVYRAYLAGLLYPDLLECAFCYCGCASPSFNHVSAVDCFKDMHGFG